MAISDSTLTANVWTDIKNLIVSANPTVTNSSTGATTLAGVKAVFNDSGAARPQIVIAPVTPDKKNDKFGQTVSAKFITVVIDCYGKNTLEIDQLFDQSLYQVETNVIAGIELVGIASDYAFNVAAGSKYEMKSLILSYDRE